MFAYRGEDRALAGLTLASAALLTPSTQASHHSARVHVRVGPLRSRQFDVSLGDEYAVPRLLQSLISDEQHTNRDVTTCKVGLVNVGTKRAIASNRDLMSVVNETPLGTPIQLAYTVNKSVSGENGTWSVLQKMSLPELVTEEPATALAFVSSCIGARPFAPLAATKPAAPATAEAVRNELCELIGTRMVASDANIHAVFCEVASRLRETQPVWAGEYAGVHNIAALVANDLVQTASMVRERGKGHAATGAYVANLKPHAVWTSLTIAPVVTAEAATVGTATAAPVAAAIAPFALVAPIQRHMCGSSSSGGGSKKGSKGQRAIASQLEASRMTSIGNHMKLDNSTQFESAAAPPTTGNRPISDWVIRPLSASNPFGATSVPAAQQAIASAISDVDIGAPASNVGSLAFVTDDDSALLRARARLTEAHAKQQKPIAADRHVGFDSTAAAPVAAAKSAAPLPSLANDRHVAIGIPIASSSAAAAKLTSAAAPSKLLATAAATAPAAAVAPVDAHLFVRAGSVQIVFVNRMHGPDGRPVASVRIERDGTYVDTMRYGHATRRHEFSLSEPLSFQFLDNSTSPGRVVYSKTFDRSKSGLYTFVLRNTVQNDFVLRLKAFSELKADLSKSRVARIVHNLAVGSAITLSSTDGASSRVALCQDQYVEVPAGKQLIEMTINGRKMSTAVVLRAGMDYSLETTPQKEVKLCVDNEYLAEKLESIGYSLDHINNPEADVFVFDCAASGAVVPRRAVKTDKANVFMTPTSVPITVSADEQTITHGSKTGRVVASYANPHKVGAKVFIMEQQ